MDNSQNIHTLNKGVLLELSKINLCTPQGRPLFRDLNMVLEREKVAIIGRNGVGKSTLLKTITGELQPNGGIIQNKTKPYLVPQQISSNKMAIRHILTCLFSTDMLAKELNNAGLPSLSELNHSNYLSYGEIRKLHLLVAKLNCPDMLLLDEPTGDLDETGIKWLTNWISAWQNGLLVVSHDRLLLSCFNHFFIITESGCSYFPGTFGELNLHLENEAYKAESKYFKNLRILVQKEEHNDKILRRRRRKKNFGRISELDRCTPKQRINKKRINAQVNQGKASKISQNRLGAARDLVLDSRRAIAVNLPLELPVPEMDTAGNRELIRLEAVSVQLNQRFLFRHIDLSLRFERFAIVGPNGAGKTTLLNIIRGKIKPCNGNRTITGRLGAITQGGTNWMIKESLLSLLMARTKMHTLDEIAKLLLMHKFPIALANRELCSLSPGERVRAALIYLYQQRPEIQILLLDEPTYSLDFVGETSLRTALKAWPGALIVSSHNSEFLASIGVSRRLELDGHGNHALLVC